MTLEKLLAWLGWTDHMFGYLKFTIETYQWDADAGRYGKCSQTHLQMHRYTLHSYKHTVSLLPPPHPYIVYKLLYVWRFFVTHTVSNRTQCKIYLFPSSNLMLSLSSNKGATPPKAAASVTVYLCHVMSREFLDRLYWNVNFPQGLIKYIHSFTQSFTNPFSPVRLSSVSPGLSSTSFCSAVWPMPPPVWCLNMK